MPTKKELTETPKPTLMPKEFSRGSQTFTHRIYKMHLANMKHNLSWKYLQPEIKEIEHVHFFHDVNKSGRPNKYCAPIGGHFHEVKVDWTQPAIKKEITLSDGTKQMYEGPQFTCGPPLQFKTIRIPGSKRAIKKPVPVKYDAVDSMGEMQPIVDTHTHFVEYQGSETISEATRRQVQEGDRAAIQTMVNKNAVASQAEALEKLKLGQLSSSGAK